MRTLAIGVGVMWSAVATAGDVQLKTADGVTLHAVEYGAGPNGVVLVHDKGRSAADWSWFAERLAGNGFHVVALDLRGHGTSKPPELLTDADYPKMVADVTAAVTWLNGRGASKVALIGDKLGANLAIVAGADDMHVTNVIALSPGLNVAGVTPSSAVEKYGERPLMLVVSAEDSYAVRSGALLEEKAKGLKHLEMLEGAGSGVKMLNKAPALEPAMIAWLNGTFFQNAASTQADKTSNIKGPDAGAIQTTGQKYGDAPKEPAPAPPPSGPVNLDDE